MSVTLTYKLASPKKHSIRAKCVSHEGVSDYYVSTEVLELLGLKYNDELFMTLSKEPSDVAKS